MYTGFRGQSQGFPCLFFWCLAYCDRSGFVHIKRAWRHTYGESQGRQSFNPLTIPEVMIWFAEAHTEQRRRRQGSSWNCFQAFRQYRRSAGSIMLHHPPYSNRGINSYPSVQLQWDVAYHFSSGSTRVYNNSTFLKPITGRIELNGDPDT